MTPARVLTELRGAAAALRFDPDGRARPSARAERIAAGALGLLLLAGAIATYAVASGLGLRMGVTPSDDTLPGARVVHTSPTRRPTPTGPAPGPVPSLVAGPVEVARTPVEPITARPRRPRTPVTAATTPPVPPVSTPPVSGPTTPVPPVSPPVTNWPSESTG